MRFLDMLDLAMVKKMEELKRIEEQHDRLNRKLHAVAEKGEDRVFWKEGMETMRLKTNVIRRRRIA